MRTTTLATTAVFTATLAAAQNKTLPFFFPGADSQELVASIVTANPSTTVAQISCPTGEDASDCGFGPGAELSIISTTIYQATLSEEGEFTMSFTCTDDAPKTELTCTISMGGPGANDPGETSAVLSGTDAVPISAVVTAGAEMLGAAATGGASGSASQTGMQTSVTGGAKPTTTGASATNAKASGTASSAPSGTGAAYKFSVEGGALIALAGVAAVGVW